MLIREVAQKLPRRHWKYVLLSRFLLIIVVFIIYYIRSFFITTTTDNPTANHQLNENSIVSDVSTQRKILSVLTNPEKTHKDVNCTKPSILAFPSDGLTRDERRHGWIIVHMVLMFYGFWFLASICDDYLVPSIEQICAKNNIQRDVIGATLMAAAVSSPELFMSFIGTFITKGDIGVGTILGSAVFNVLAVPACCGLFAASYLKLDWWPITRDCFMYLAAVLLLVGILWDGQVWWYEALMLVLSYFGYMLTMYHQKKICRFLKNFMRKYGYFRPQYTEINEFSHLLKSKNNNHSKYGLAVEAYEVRDFRRNSSHVMLYLEQQEKEEPIASPWYLDRHQSLIEFICRWPITFLLWLTVPNCRFKASRKYFTLFMSIIWISAISYVMAFVITVIGDTLLIPDAVMGLTVLAAGMSIPEAVSSIIVTKQGQGGMGLSNSLGSNTFDILLSLGLPWFIKSFFLPDIADEKFLTLNSSSLTYAGIILLTSLLGLYLVFLYYDFTLQRSVGIWCVVMYASFMMLATLVELNLFFPVNLPVCRH
ncbi:hypothetical protein DOY81_007263 [Sarcophaga bullata]|nr:hypothetical protein DOY81_007263 [Sarcophaga bullata]